MAVGFDQWFYTPAERGLLAENFPGYLTAAANLVPTQGRMEMLRLKVPQAGQCSNVNLHVNIVGASMTAGQNFAALYTAAGSLIAQSVDQSTNWTTLGTRSAQLNGGPYFLHSGEYYVAFWWNGGTAPAITRSANGNHQVVNGNTAAPNFLAAFASGPYTTAAPAVLPAQNGLGTAWWVALS